MISTPDPMVLFQNYLIALNNNPVRTKGITSGILSGVSELTASIIAGEKDPKTGSYLTPRVAKMALYGLLVSGPLSHKLMDLLQRAFNGHTSTAAKLLQILASNLIVSPISNTVFLVFMAIFAGARNINQVVASVRVTFLPVMRSTWCTSPILVAFAQKYLPKMVWTPFFSLFSFFLSTYNNVLIKKRRQAELKKKQNHHPDHPNKQE